MTSGLKLGQLQLQSRYWLSPLAGYTNWPFRLAVRELGGVGLATTDLVNARALLSRSARTLELIDTSPEDRPLAVQIYGAEPEYLAEAARWLEAYGASVIDINMGCPVNKVTRNGGGSALLCDARGTVNLVRRVVDAVRIPVTVKMRLGWDASDLSAPHFAREFEKLGVAAVIIHGRTREQGFAGQVNLDGIRAVVEAVERMPIIGNGDVRTVADAERMLLTTGCAGISIGRGALLNPWIFQELCAWEQANRAEAAAPVGAGTPASPTMQQRYSERLDFMSRHFHLLVQQRGERFACITFRKVANWYCRVLRPGREIQQRLMMLSAVRDFDDMVAFLRQRGAPPHWKNGADVEIAVPGGPIAHW